jgi:phosphatidylglycerol---prolipoprotein diacylglyceryl transferase
MTLCFITWNVSPEMFSIGPITLRWYGLLFALSFVIGYIIMQRMFAKENLPISLLDELATYMIIATVVGARLGHVLFYEPESYLKHPLDILKIWEGGLASHGAAVGIMIALYFFARHNKKPYLWAFDRVVIVVALAGFFIRTGNLMNSEIFGKPTDLPWAFIFTRVSGIPRHPTQIYEALCYLASFFLLLNYYYKKNGNPRTGSIFGMFLILIFGVRIFIEFLKEPQVGFENSMTFNMGQILSVPFVLLGIYLLFRRTAKT